MHVVLIGPLGCPNKTSCNNAIALMQAMLEKYFETIGHRLDDCTIDYKHNANGAYRVVFLFFSSLEAVSSHTYSLD